MVTQETKPLWLVRPRLDAAHYREKLLGSVVKYPDLPTERYIPSPHDGKETRLPRDIVPSLEPRPVTIRNVRFWTRRIRDLRVHASVSEILEGFAGRESGSAEENVATVARVWHVERAGEVFEALLRDEAYLGQLICLLGGCADKKAYFVTDVVSLVNTRVRDVAARGADVGAAMGVLGSDAGGSMSGRLTGAGWGLRARTSRGLEACYEEETIVFLGYRLVRLEKVAGARARLRRMVCPLLSALRGGRGGRAGGFTVRDGFDYWPEMAERPVEGDAEGMFLGAGTPTGGLEAAGEEDEYEETVRELGFDVEVVG